MTDAPAPVLVTTPLQPDHLARIRAISPRVRVTFEPDTNLAPAGAYLAAHPETEVVFSPGLPHPWQPTPRSRLRWVQSSSAGVDSELEKAIWKASEVIVTTASGIHGPPMSQWAIAMILHHALNLGQLLRFKETRRWEDRDNPTLLQRVLIGSVLGLVGYGSIGRECARLGRALGMRVLATRRTAPSAERASANPRFVPAMLARATPLRSGPDEVEMVALADLHCLLAQCDYVVVTAPATAETRHLLGAPEFAAMKRGAFLLNVSRGSLLDEQALIQALQSGHLGGAALDVFDPEPPRPDNPLFDLPNVLLTPHLSGAFQTYWDLATEAFCENLARYLDGRPLLNVADRDRSY